MMDVDIRWPIGGMFTILGTLLSIFGFLTNTEDSLYSISFGINVNLWTGLFMLIFGLVMVLLAYRSKK